MSDLSYLEIGCMLISLLGVWLTGFQQGRWAGIQRAEQRQLQRDRMRQAVNKF